MAPRGAVIDFEPCIAYGSVGETYVDFNSNAIFGNVEERMLADGNRIFLGHLHDQEFYAIRHVSGGSLSIPFQPRPFTALIHTRRNLGEKQMEKIVRALLDHGMAYALCIGEHAERVSLLIDRLVDDHDYTRNDMTVYSDASQEESINEAMEYFVLPSGLGDTGLILSIGDESDHGDATAAFDSLLGEGYADADPAEEEEYPLFVEAVAV